MTISFRTLGIPLRSLRSCATVATAVVGILASSPGAFADSGTPSQAAPSDNSNDGAAKVTLQTTDNPDTNGPDSQRVNDSYQPKGIPVGEFLFLPKIETDESYNSNVYATQTNVKADVLTDIRPELNLRSQFSEHELNFSLTGDREIYSTYSKDNQTNGAATVDGRYDFNKDAQLSVFSQAYAQHEDRSSPYAVQGVEPTPTQGILNHVTFKDQYGRFSILGAAEVNRLTFYDVMTSTGSVINNADRDRWELSLRERGAYEMFPGYAAVLQVTENTHIFDRTLDHEGYNRNSTGYRAEAGLGVDITRLIRGDFLLGYFQQDYQDARLPSANGLSMRALFNWTPTKLTIVIPSIDRTVTDTTQSGASGLDRSAFTLTVRHELARNIVLTGFGGVYYDQLTGVQNQDDITYEARTKIIYAFSPEFYVGGEVGFMSKRSEAQLASFDQLTTMIKLGVQY